MEGIKLRVSAKQIYEVFNLLQKQKELNYNIWQNLNGDWELYSEEENNGGETLKIIKSNKELFYFIVNQLN